MTLTSIIQASSFHNLTLPFHLNSIQLTHLNYPLLLSITRLRVVINPLNWANKRPRAANREPCTTFDMFANSAFAVAVFAASAAAKTCTNLTVPVTISARTGVFNIPVPQTNFDATAFIQNQTQQGRNFTETALSGYATTAGTYDISAQFCMPSDMDTIMALPTLQVLTHGIGFDKT